MTMDSHIIRHAKLKALNDRGHWIQTVTQAPGFKKGAFTKKAKAAGYKTKAYMSHVLEHPDMYDPTTRSQAQFMKNILHKE
jgi:hypothetical protein